MTYDPNRKAPANDEAPTTRLRRISDEIDAADEGFDKPCFMPIDPSPVISIDGHTSFCVGFTEDS